MKKKIFVLNGNPKEQSFTGALAEAYKNAAQQKHDVLFQSLSRMEFDPNLANGYSSIQPLEDDLKEFQELIQWADHFVMFTPIWWGGLPAKLKGLIDRTFLPNFAFKYVEGQPQPNKLLTGRSARVIMTMDSPPWYFRFFQGATGAKQLKNNTLQFSGFSPVKTTFLGPIISSDAAKREKWLGQVEGLGKSGK